MDVILFVPRILHFVRFTFFRLVFFVFEDILNVGRARGKAIHRGERGSFNFVIPRFRAAGPCGGCGSYRASGVSARFLNEYYCYWGHGGREFWFYRRYFRCWGVWLPNTGINNFPPPMGNGFPV